MRRRVPLSQWGLAGVTANALRPPSDYWLGAASMITGGPASELAPHLLAGTVAASAAGLLRGRRGPASVALSAATVAGQAALIRRALAAGPAVDAALDAAIGRAAAPAPRTVPPAGLWPVPRVGKDIEVLRDIPYADGLPGDDADSDARIRRLCRLDVYRPRGGARPGGAAGPAPILLHVHGGMWMGSDKRYEARPLLLRMAARGWVCVSINYRLCPHDPYPAQIIDVKRAIAWTRAHAADFGADPSFLAITGGSAGGHLAALAALSAGDPSLQPGFEDADTSVQAAVPQYGIYDFTAQSRTDHAVKRRDRFLAPRVLGKDPQACPEAFAAASPLLRAHAGAPPFFVLHGTLDTGVEVAESRYFVEHLRAVSRQVVAYAELPGAQHAYDHLDTLRVRRAGEGIARFLEWCAARR